MRECEVSGGQKNRRETLRSDCQESGTNDEGRSDRIVSKKGTETQQMHGVPPIPQNRKKHCTKQCVHVRCIRYLFVQGKMISQPL